MKPFIFMHIPKTAGSSFKASLEEVFGEGYCNLTPHGKSWPEVHELKQYHQAFSGHIFSDHGIYRIFPEHTSVTILRDPVERVIDAYNFLYECSIHPLHEQARKTPFEDALRNSHVNWGLKDLMVWHLSGMIHLHTEPEARLALAKEVLKDFDFFGFTEQYGDFINECNRRMGWSTNEKRINIGSYNPQYGENVRELIVENNLLDLELYKFARLLKKDHSQYGEATLLADFFDKHPPKNKFLVDVGAFSIELSNTFNFLLRDWKGILIEAMPQEEYFRPLVEALRDSSGVTILAGVAIGDYEGAGTAFLNKIPGQRSLLQELENDGSREVPVRPLAPILQEHGVPLDFDLLSVDAEGFDERILKCLLTQSAYRPRVIVFEKDAHFKMQPPEEPRTPFLEDRGYNFLFETEGNLAYTLENP